MYTVWCHQNLNGDDLVYVEARSPNELLYGSIGSQWLRSGGDADHTAMLCGVRLEGGRIDMRARVRRVT